MFWLVRAAPGHLLRLQGGRFDAPDRLFCSIREAWESVLASTSDVKELIPEFFLSDARCATFGMLLSARLHPENSSNAWILLIAS